MSLRIPVHALMFTGLVLLNACELSSTEKNAESDLAQPMKGVIITDGWSAHTGDAKSFVAAYKTAGCNVLGFELSEYNRDGDPEGLLKEQTEKLKVLDSACHAEGLWCEVVLNSNDTIYNSPDMTTDKVIESLHYIAEELGTDVIIQPWSESASSRIDGNAVRLAAETIFPHVVTYEDHATGVGQWVEVHPCSVNEGLRGHPAVASTWVVTDCGTLLTDNASSRLAAYGRSVVAQGASFSLYGSLPSASAALAADVFSAE